LWWLRPHHLFGIEGMDPISHACFWSMVFNLGSFVIISVFSSIGVEERTQGDVFVNIEKYTGSPDIEVIRREASASRLKDLLHRFLGPAQARLAIKKFKGKVRKGKEADDIASPEFIAFVEQTLTGAFGSASAKILIGSDIRQATPTIDELNEMLNQTKEILAYSTALEDKTKELESASKELHDVNQQLKALDTLKAEFISTVTHELRTPITTIRSFAQILEKGNALSEEQSRSYLSIIIKECDRIKNLVNQVLDVERLEILQGEGAFAVNAHQVLAESIERLQPQLNNRGIEPKITLKARNPWVGLAEDKLLQIFINLLSNAIKFSDADQPKLEVLSYDG
ncbi:MAG TPA: HAMP domain-containing sensor histidine kinase, partial [Saprospiraceae bacterium]|nr:HAMP domain-containing sensor histidine kinase [Saprospiraceae bacterium]